MYLYINVSIYGFTDSPTCDGNLQQVLVWQTGFNVYYIQTLQDDNKEENMLEVTAKASEMIKDFLKDKEVIPAIRIMLSQGGWSGPSLGLALDESKETDEVFDDRGLTYVVDRPLYESIKPITVDYVNSPMGAGFNIASNMQMGASCGSSCGSC